MNARKHKVFGVGLGRTGTASLQLALKQLGYKTAHFLPYRDLLNEYDRGTRSFMGSGTFAFIDRYDAISNGTGLPFQALERRYTDSRFILTLRDPDRWLASQQRYRAALAKRDMQRGDNSEGASRFINENIYGAATFEASAWIQAFEEHKSAVLKHFRESPEKLLTFDVAAGDSWGQLCSFLGHQTVEGEFPHSNDQRTAEQEFALPERLRKTAERLGIGLQPFLLADMGHGDISAPTATPFPSRDGIWWGNPESDAAALREIRSHWTKEPEFLVFTWATLWYLDEYDAFATFVHDTCDEVYSGPDCRVFRPVRRAKTT
ncbi:sulfotransferase family protein [Tropicimonas aquimaris]|uniref:Sulfotransferase family protein n=1 Tax=Tropicimonas aquimaris TaxID=914152 RepID=A0ABW3IQY2_9RHOB